jgi:hypothetical protein
MNYTEASTVDYFYDLFKSSVRVVGKMVLVLGETCLGKEEGYHKVVSQTEKKFV